MAWVVLFVAGLLEVGWAVCLKSSRGFTVFWPSLGFAAFMFASVYLLGVSLKSLPLGTAYTVWTGIGAVGSVVVGVLMFGESGDPRRLACVGMVVAGIVGLKFLSPH
ncbi:DMT family transporter [Paludisphaera rhizosphaerae]|uniref:DMT family transporter n=1 Tax=Paludisphaera rhizosphaerae TaxID=2711216 RepID=UPI0013ECA487|nr:multidrug efflux SMR transporter [Paludisphaera rhizosphaerae]